ncbi:hypothetical protein D3C86_1268660 [compost metagenome]
MVRRQRFGTLRSLHRPALALAADAGGGQALERAAFAAEQIGIGRYHLVGIVDRIRALDPQRPMKDRRQGGFQFGQFGRAERLGRDLVARVRLARQFAAVPGLFRAVQEDPAGIAQAVPRAAGVQQLQVFRGGKPDQGVQRLRGFLEYGGPGAQQESCRPAQVPGQILPAIAELDGVVLQQAGQLAPQAGMVERHQRAAGQDAGIAHRRFHARFLPVHQGDRHAPAQQFECAADSDDARAQDDDLLSHVLFFVFGKDRCPAQEAFLQTARQIAAPRPAEGLAGTGNCIAAGGRPVGNWRQRRVRSGQRRLLPENSSRRRNTPPRSFLEDRVARQVRVCEQHGAVHLAQRGQACVGQVAA